MGLSLIRCVVSGICAGAVALMAQAQTDAPQVDTSQMRQVSAHSGEMVMTFEAIRQEVTDSLRFEPYQQLEDMFLRNDVVFVMRHGPTDWSKLDEKAVDPEDCANQRVMVEAGHQRMRDLGALMAANGVVPAQIVTSQWCRNQQTVDALLEGFARVDPAIAAQMPVETDPALNLLLSLNGAQNVSGLRARVASWEGHAERPGPLLLVTHYTNIEELTQFRVFEGESLVLDPKRDNQVLGYLRLKSAAPDVGHFSDALNAPLLETQVALDMVERYYAAINSGRVDQMRQLLSDRWVGYGIAEVSGKAGVEDWLAELSRIAEGLSDTRFEVEGVHVADEVVTVTGTVRGTHTGTLFGIPATGRDVAFRGIAVHRIDGGEIVESWQMSDRLGLIQQIR